MTMRSSASCTTKLWLVVFFAAASTLSIVQAADQCNDVDVWSGNPWSSNFRTALSRSRSLQCPSSDHSPCIDGSNLKKGHKRVKDHFQPAANNRAIFKLDGTKVTYKGKSVNARCELRSENGYDRVSGKAVLYSSAKNDKVYSIGQLFSSKADQPVVRIEVRDEKVWPVIQYKAGDKAKRDTAFSAPNRENSGGVYFRIDMASDRRKVTVKIGGTSKTYSLSGYQNGSTYVKAGVYANSGSGSVSTNFEYINFSS